MYPLQSWKKAIEDHRAKDQDHHSDTEIHGLRQQVRQQYQDRLDLAEYRQQDRLGRLDRLDRRLPLGHGRTKMLWSSMTTMYTFSTMSKNKM